MPGKVALIIVFNHRYDKNISVLEEIYKERFSNIYHLVPFYDGDKANVIPVYESSFYFQGYLAQGLRHYFREEYEHYLFVADDLILNPSINENNYKEHFKLSPVASYLPEIFPLHALINSDTLRFTTSNNIAGKAKKLYWWRIREVVKYKHEKEGVEIKNEMPSFAQAEAKLKSHGYHIKPLTFYDVYEGLFPLSISTRAARMQAVKFFYRLRHYNKQFHLSYPLVGAYSDIVIVSGSSIKRFCHYCGVFAANELFVEFAIPTALLLASDEVVTEPAIGKRGSIFWTYSKQEAAAYEKEMEPYHYNLKELLENFPAHKLYIHPVKLSKWKTKLA